jgi:hypothetical protein
MADPFVPHPFLRSLEPFDGWDAAPLLGPALADLGSRAEVWTFREGDLVRFPDEASPGPTWVAEGCLVVLEEAGPRYVGVRERLESPGGLWVRGQTSGRFVTVPEASWRAWLAAWPRAAERLGEPVPPPLPRGLLRSPLVLEPGETPVHLFRKAPLFLVLRALVPGLFFLFFLAFGTLVQVGFGARVSALALWFLPTLGMAVAAALVALAAWEWSVSVVVVTDRSVLLRQVDVWSHRSDFEKLALDRIREAVFARSGLVAALLGLVNLELEGDSPRGRLVFRGLARTSRFLEAMEHLRVKRSSDRPDRRTIRRSLADRAGGARAPVLERAPERKETPGPRVHRLSWRVERSGGVWFRRHPWHVWRRSVPWLGWAALAVFLGVVAGVLVPGRGAAVAGITVLAAAFPLGRVGWLFWDWADDQLSIQGDRIVMVHRRPLWFGEVRQEGSLDQVEQVGVRKDSLAALVLDFGDLSVSLGAADPLVFTDAAHPEWVQNEIFHRRTLLARDRERKDSQTRLDEVSEILDTWDEARKAGYFTEGKEPL